MICNINVASYPRRPRLFRVRYLVSKMASPQNDTCQLIEKYFHLGFQQKEILAFLKHLHKITISHRTLKRSLSSMNLYRRKNYAKIEDVVNFLEMEISNSSQLHGYKWMHLRCLQNNINITQDFVRELLLILDPEGVSIRKKRRLRRRQYFNKGPNYLWHMDSYDKLKPYGICINGCIDGFSRHIIYLRAGSTSSDPKGISYKVSVKGCPKTLRCDLGTENSVVKRFQESLHELFNEDPSPRPSFLYGKSCHNQRIEAWWAILRKHSAQFWMNLFEALKEDNNFDGTFLDKSLIQFCFMDLIQNNLDIVVLEWNVHKIRRVRNSTTPSGRPCIMYEMPAFYEAQNYLMKLPDFAMEALQSQCVSLEYPCDRDVFELCNILLAENDWTKKENPFDAADLYVKLRDILMRTIDTM